MKFYQKWWFWLIIVFVFVEIIYIIRNPQALSNNTSNNTTVNNLNYNILTNTVNNTANNTTTNETNATATQTVQEDPLYNVRYKNIQAALNSVYGADDVDLAMLGGAEYIKSDDRYTGTVKIKNKITGKKDKKTYYAFFLNDKDKTIVTSIKIDGEVIYEGDLGY